MTQQSMEERFDEKFIGCGDAFCSKHQFRGQVDGRVGENLPEHLKQFISQEIERARQEVVSEVVEMVNEMSIKDRTTGTPYGLASVIHQLKKKYNLE